MNHDPILLASPGAYERLIHNDPAIQEAYAWLIRLAFSGPVKESHAFCFQLEDGNGVITLEGDATHPTVFILAGDGEGFGPPEAHRIPDGHGVYPTQEEIRRGRYGSLKTISIV